MSTSSRRGFLAGLALAGLVLPGCAAPTLPLPPPSIEALEAPDAMGNVTVRGLARPGAYIFVLNEDREMGVIGTADATTGMYAIPVGASSGETITVWQMVGSQTGQLVSRVVP